jgi:hypothetical protein
MRIHPQYRWRVGTNPYDPDPWITMMKDGRTHLAHTAEHPHHRVAQSDDPARRLLLQDR